MDSINGKVTVVIRSVGERTESLCRQLILAQGIVEANVVIVREAPFSAALRKSYEIGIAQGRLWTLCNDADVLLRPGAVARMVELAEQQPENVCEIQGYVLDKFFGGPRQGGIHLYRTSLLPQVLDNIPEEGINIRPETHALEAMRKQGYPWVSVPYIVGLHDFEQYYRDIFRKSFVHAHKHQHMAELFLPLWRDGEQQDFDYQLALLGFARGIEHSGEVLIDTRQDVYARLFAELHVEEKPALCLDSYSPESVEQMILQWREHKAYLRKFPTKMGLEVPQEAPRLSRREKMALHVRRLGLLRTVPYAVGWLLQRAGVQVQLWADVRKTR